MTNVLSNKELITSQRDTILSMLEDFGAEIQFRTDIAETILNENHVFSCHISYDLGKHHGYFSLLVSDNFNVYDFPVNGIRSGDFDWVKDAFWIYLKMVKVYCGGKVE